MKRKWRLLLLMSFCIAAIFCAVGIALHYFGKKKDVREREIIDRTIKILSEIRTRNDARERRDDLSKCGRAWRSTRDPDEPDLSSEAFLFELALRDRRPLIFAEYNRLLSCPGVLRELSNCFPIRYMEETRETNAQRDIGELTSIVIEFRFNTGDFPKDLTDLENKYWSDPDRPFPYSTDPWGARYEYDRSGIRNSGTLPDIWSHGPPYKKELIGNWQSWFGR